jgi:glucose dehydrogenase
MKTMRIGVSTVAGLMVLTAWTLSGQSPASLSPGLPITYERLLKADQEPGNWLMYSGNYAGWRFSKLNQITTQNAKNLRV